MFRIQRGPAEETAGQMYERLRAERAARKADRKANGGPAGKLAMGMARGALTFMGVHMANQVRSREREAIEGDVKRRQPDLAGKDLREAADAAWDRQMGMSRMMLQGAMRPPRPLPDTSRIDSYGRGGGLSL